MIRVALGLEYDGTLFQGFQRQQTARTIQLVLEEALSQFANEPIQINCAGRTDAGVHAINQVVHFDTNAQREERSWVLGPNSLLSKDVVVKWAKVVDERFHARFSALSRHYRYIILNQDVRTAIFRNCVTRWPYPLNKTEMQTAAQYLLGEHDFSSFRGADCQSKTTIRQIDSIEICRHKDFLITDIIANAFLHHMIRNIMGVLLKIGVGKEKPQWILEVLEACDRTAGAMTAPPQGLYLMGVRYPDEFQIPEETFAKGLF